MANETTDYTSYDYITKKSEDYLSMSSNNLLNKARLQYDNQYDSAIYNAHKFLQSACAHCASVLDKTTEVIQAKGELLKNGIDIFVHTPEPEPQAIGNTALVVPKLTAESDLQNRYETPQGSESGSSSGGATSSAHITNIGPAPGKGKENIPSSAEQWTIDLAEKASNILGIPCDWIWGQWANESGHFNADTRDYHNYAGIGPWKRFETDDDFVNEYCLTISHFNPPNAVQAKTYYEFIRCLQEPDDGQVYCADPPGTDSYYAACAGALGNEGTTL